MALTQLYAATKLSYTTSFPQITPSDGAELLSLQRKYRIQRDRLIAWGLEWSDNTSTVASKISTRTTAPDYSPGLGFIFTGKASNTTRDTKANIDDSLERAGLAEIVMSVLENINGIITEVEQIRKKTIHPLSPAGFPLDKPGFRTTVPTPWTASDRSHYEDLVKDLTSSLDLLCDLSHARRGTPPAPPLTESVKSLDTTATTALVNLQASPRVGTTRYELDPSLTVPKLAVSSIRLTGEPPPPYNHFGVPCPVRVIGQIHRETLPRSSALYHERLGPTDSVLIEYAPYDSIHRETGLALPLSRLDTLFGLSRYSGAQPLGSIPKLIGYFEDPLIPQLGLVYELPSHVRTNLSNNTGQERMTSKVTNLMNLLQSGASRIHNNRQSSMTEVMYVPPLEERFVVAHKLVQAFSFLHAQGLHHCGVNSYNIVFLSKPESATGSTPSEGNFTLREPIITSFDLFSEYRLDTSPEYLHQNIYRHPDDPNVTAPGASKEYLPAFELYSLGLILLEIGLWIPLSDMFKEKYSLKEFRTRIEKLYTKRLAGKCGTAYMRAVMDCLAAGNETGVGPGCLNPFYSRILGKLQKCSALDDDEPPGDEVSSETLLLDRAVQSPVESVISAGMVDVVASSNQSLLYAGDATRPSRYWFWDISVPKDCSKAWPAQSQRIGRIVTKAIGNSKETLSIAIMMTGAHLTTAKPSFVVGCTSVNIVLAWIERYFEFDKNKYDLVVVEDSIAYSKATKAVPETPSRSNGPAEIEAMNPGYHARPLCGASIGAYIKEDELHLQPVSFGGVVLVDGKPYGMSVHHMMEDDDKTEDETNASRSVLPHSPAMPSERFEDFEEETDSDKFGDTAGIIPTDGEKICVTQPALDDVAEGFFPDEDDRDDDHLCSHSLGHVYASSGLRRSSVNGVTYEIDWALIKLADERLQPFNIIAGGRRFSQPRHGQLPPKLIEPVCREPYKAFEDLFAWRIVAIDEFEDFPVHVLGRTSGLVFGRMFKDVVQVRFPGRRQLSAVWRITGSLGPAGNSGAWVIENTEGRVCGHVLGKSKTLTNIAYMSAMDMIFDDIKETLSARSITLPGAEGLTSNGNGVERRRSGSQALPDMSSLTISSPSNRASEAEATLKAPRKKKKAVARR